MRIYHEELNSSAYEYRLEIYEPDQETAGLYKCVVKNNHGQLQVNLNLNVGRESQEKEVI